MALSTSKSDAPNLPSAFLLILAGLALASCQSTTQPSGVPPSQVPPPSSGSEVLAIMPPLTGLKLGASAALAAVVTSGNGGSRLVAASWSSDVQAVAAIQPDGRLDGVRLGATTIRAVYETLIATRSVRVVPDYAGDWTGWYRTNDCRRLSGDGPSACRFLVGGRFGVRATLTQDGDSVSGTLDLFDNTGRVIVETGRVTGPIDATNALALSGVTRSADAGEQNQTVLSEWNSTTENDVMAGTFTQTATFRNFWGIQQMQYSCALEEVHRVSLGSAAR